MNALAIALIWKCFALDTAAGVVYSGEGATETIAQASALQECEINENWEDIGNCFPYSRCEQVPDPGCVPVCNPDHTQCSCTIEPNPPAVIP